MNVSFLLMTSEDDIYYTLSTPQEAEIKIKGSRFIASVFPTPNKEIATAMLENVRSKHYDATHNCFAYMLGKGGAIFRYSDDGEPSGSAGKPIYMAIQKYNISDILVVVTRYFGGTLLGVGGLVKAYNDATDAVLSKCIELDLKKIIHITLPVQIDCNYEEINVVKRLVSEQAVSFTEEYADKIKIIANIHKSQADAFAEKIVTATFARASAKILFDNESF